MRTLVALLLLTASGMASAESQQVVAVVNAVLDGAKYKDADYKKVQALFPSSLVARDYEDIARLLLLDKLDVEQVGDKGVTYKWSAIHHAIQKLGDIQDGAKSIVRLWESKELSWDGANSLELCDAAVRRGKEMVPLLSNVSRGQDAARRCIELIVKGRQTAF